MFAAIKEYTGHNQYDKALEVLSREVEAIVGESLDIPSKIKEMDKDRAYAQIFYGMALIGLGRKGEAFSMLQGLARKLYITEMYEESEVCDLVLYNAGDKDIATLDRVMLYSIRYPKGRDRLTKADQCAGDAANFLNVVHGRDKALLSYHIRRVSLSSLNWESNKRLGSGKEITECWANEGVNEAFVYQQSCIETTEDRLDYLDTHRIWGEKLEASIDKNAMKRRVRQRLNNKIRLGISSTGFRDNHIGHYIMPLVENIDKDKFEIYCYSHWPKKGCSLKSKFEETVDDFKEFAVRQPHQEVAQVMADDCLDSLIEVGHWSFRAEVIAYKPAPVQISWLDYLHSMGLPTAIDYIVMDPYVMPENPGLLIEKPIVLPDVWMVMDRPGFAYVPITSSTPEDRKGYITFGTMSRPHRFTEETFKVWGGIMSMVPNSRFIYIRPEATSKILQDNFCKNMEKYGISRDRISFIATPVNFMEHFNEIDIALDTFPDIGNTTTCYTLWMGLPLVTLVGPCFFERVSYSALMNCGLGDPCAFSLLEYHNIALGLVADKERRRHIRNNLRSWILNGPLGQPKMFADSMGEAIADVLGRS